MVYLTRFFSGLWWRLVHFGFRLLYNELAFTYDTVSKIVSLGAWRCWQRASLTQLMAPPGGLVLEIAHGTGDLQLDLQNKGYRGVGVDLSPQMGRIARRKLQQQGIRPALVRGRAQQLPFGANQFAAVVITFPTEFIFETVALCEIYRVLVARGQLVVVLSSVLVGGGIVARWLEWLYRATGQRESGRHGRSPDRIRELFEACGFDVEFRQEKCPRSIALVVVARRKD